MQMTTKQKGNLTELQCISAFMSEGYNVSIPFGEDTRYDFIADDGKNLLRIQVKTCKLRKNHTITFKTESIRGAVQGKSRTAHYTKEEIDYFATFYDGECFVVPVEEGNHHGIVLHLKDKTKNNQFKGIKFCKDYRLKDLTKRQVVGAEPTGGSS